MADKTFQIRMEPGPYRREMGAFVWDAANNWTAEVDVATAAELLTEPADRFTLAARPSGPALKALAQALGVKPENIIVPDGEPVTADAVEE